MLANIPTLASKPATGRLATGLAISGRSRPVTPYTPAGEHAQQQLEPGQAELGADPVQRGPAVRGEAGVQQPAGWLGYRAAGISGAETGSSPA